METSPEPLAGLIREHRLIEATVAATLNSVRAATATPDDGVRADVAIEQLWLLQLLLEREVALHIEKEERVLFPVLRQAIDGRSRLIDYMIDEHDEIKSRRDGLGQALTALDREHEDVHRLQAAVQDAAARVQHGDITANLRELGKIIEQLDWVFQGHFTGEEDGLFLPAEDMLSADTLEAMAAQMAAMDAAGTA